MTFLNNFHSQALSEALVDVLGQPLEGTMAYIDCLDSEVMRQLVVAPEVSKVLKEWSVWYVTDQSDEAQRMITADKAVELRELKHNATLLLVDVGTAGAGMSGIYNSAREVTERELFGQAVEAAKQAIASAEAFDGTNMARYVDQALRKSRALLDRTGVSPWREFDFICRVMNDHEQPGKHLHLLGMWPVQDLQPEDMESDLQHSRLLVDRLLGVDVTGLSVDERIANLGINSVTDPGIVKQLGIFVRKASILPLNIALEEIAKNPSLWVNMLRIPEGLDRITSMELVPWRKANGTLVGWSGLSVGSDQNARYYVSPENKRSLQVRWRVDPPGIRKGASEYLIEILSALEEEEKVISSRSVVHAGLATSYEKATFTEVDFEGLSEDSTILAKIRVTLIGQEEIDPVDSEEFYVVLGADDFDITESTAGRPVRTFCEGVIDIEVRDEVTNLVTALSSGEAAAEQLLENVGHKVVLKPTVGLRRYTVTRPSLLRQVEQMWIRDIDTLQRWCIKVRNTGERIGDPYPISVVELSNVGHSEHGEVIRKVISASKKMANRFRHGGGVGQLYDSSSSNFADVMGYLRAWKKLFEVASPELALVHTIEVRTQSEKTIGIIVLPSHPIRVAWHSAYDNLVLHARYADNLSAKQIRDELTVLDGSLYPAFLPGLSDDTFVFSEMLGFHAVGMVSDTNSEPKAASAILSSVFGMGPEVTDDRDGIGDRSALVLARQVGNYQKCHDAVRNIRINAFRAGDGRTVARALGAVTRDIDRLEPVEDSEKASGNRLSIAFDLSLYPSDSQREISGRFIAETRSKRRKGAGHIAPMDRWMLESISLPNGVNCPRLRWARRPRDHHMECAHVSIAFDTFRSRVENGGNLVSKPGRPLHAFGLYSFLERGYQHTDNPVWSSFVPEYRRGQKHPASPVHTEWLIGLQEEVGRLAAGGIRDNDATPTLRTTISGDRQHYIGELHNRSDWVVTVDRNVAYEYFDSPNLYGDIYDQYVIDCVPERDDLGCLQLVTSTGRIDEIQRLLGTTLDEMGLSHSQRNAKVLLKYLKALSGRLAMKLSGQALPSGELIALALAYGNCEKYGSASKCWVDLDCGFLIPIDDIQDILPPARTRTQDHDLLVDERPDFIYASISDGSKLCFQFIEVKYRKHLSMARSPKVLKKVHNQINGMQRRWDKWFRGDGVELFTALRRSRLATVLRFYANKAKRHVLTTENHELLMKEIDRMVELGAKYDFDNPPSGNLGWIFCPEYWGQNPSLLTQLQDPICIFMFGPAVLPNSNIGTSLNPSTQASQAQAKVETSKRTDTGLSSVGAPNWEKGVGEEHKASGDEKMDEEPTEHDVNIHLGTVVDSNEKVQWTPSVSSNPHLLIAGLPGMGKTTCILNVCRQMIKSGVCPIIFSYHEDIDEKLADLLEDVRYVDYDGLGFNPLDVSNRLGKFSYLDVSSTIRDVFSAVFPELGNVQLSYIRNAIRDSFCENGWDQHSESSRALIEPKFSRFIEILEEMNPSSRGLKELLVRLQELKDYGLFELGKQWHSLWEADRPIIIRVHTTQNEVLQKAFASLVIYHLYRDMFQRGLSGKITHALIIDEAHRASNLDLLPRMAKECRKFGISLVLASQEAKDFHSSLFSAIANYLVLRLSDPDAKALVRNVAGSRHAQRLIDEAKAMRRFHALFFGEDTIDPSVIALSNL